MANVTPGFTFSSTSPVDATNLNLAAQPTVTIGTAEVTNAMLSSANGIGYATGVGNGGTVTQATSKATTFTLSKATGEITTAADALNADTTVSATWTNTKFTAKDVVHINHVSGGTIGAYTFNVVCGASTGTLYLRNVTAGNLSEALVLRFVLLKGATD